MTEQQGEIDNSTIVVGYFNTPLLIMEVKTRQKIGEDIENFNTTINQLYLRDIYRSLHTTIPDYTFFSCISGTFSRIC